MILPDTYAMSIRIGASDEDTREKGGNREFRRTNANSRSSRNAAPEQVEFVTFSVHIHLRGGHGLAVRDASGSSDPYVKCVYKGRTLYRSETVYRELNPIWDEQFAFLMDDPTEHLWLKVFDYDRFMKDDFMGAARVELSTLLWFQSTELELKLEDPRAECAEANLGHLDLAATLTPLTSKERDSFLERAVRGIVTGQRIKRISKKSSSTAIISRVNILLVKAELAKVEGRTGHAETYVKFKLGTEKFKSRSVSGRSMVPQWLEQFELHMFEDLCHTMSVSVWEHRSSSAMLGRCAIDLDQLQLGQTNERWYPLEEGSGAVHLLLTISSSVQQTGNDHVQMTDSELAQRYGLSQSFRSLKDIGILTVNVSAADGLASADLNGKSDPFCVLQLVNLRAQTHTEYKTLSPNWDRTFTFAVRDIHEVLELTVFDEDSNKRAEFLGSVAIPLLKIRNGMKRWYILKDKKLVSPVKGRILVRATLHYNTLRAAWRTFTPREKKLAMPSDRFKRKKFVANINRMTKLGDHLFDWIRLARSCLSWESYPRSICALMLFTLIVLFIQLWHIPLILLVFFLRSLLQKQLSDAFNASTRRRWSEQKRRRKEYSGEEEEELDVDELGDNGTGEEEEEEEGRQEEQEEERKDKDKSLRERIQALQGTLLLIQTNTDFVLSLLERAKNTLNFSVPFLSFLAMFVLILATLLLYLVPLRWILLLWGFNKFSKRLLDPNYVDNNELLDFFSRVPSDQEKLHYHIVSSSAESSDDKDLPKVDGSLKQHKSNSPIRQMISQNQRWRKGETSTVITDQK